MPPFRALILSIFVTGTCLGQINPTNQNTERSLLSNELDYVYQVGAKGYNPIPKGSETHTANGDTIWHIAKDDPANLHGGTCTLRRYGTTAAWMYKCSFHNLSEREQRAEFLILQQASGNLEGNWDIRDLDRSHRDDYIYIDAFMGVPSLWGVSPGPSGRISPNPRHRPTWNGALLVCAIEPGKTTTKLHFAIVSGIPNVTPEQLLTRRVKVPEKKLVDSDYVGTFSGQSCYYQNPTFTNNPFDDSIATPYATCRPLELSIELASPGQFKAITKDQDSCKGELRDVEEEIGLYGPTPGEYLYLECRGRGGSGSRYGDLWVKLSPGGSGYTGTYETTTHTTVSLVRGPELSTKPKASMPNR